jgi:hypothetical protein
MPLDAHFPAAFFVLVSQKKGETQWIPPSLDVLPHLFLFHRELNSRAVGEVAAYKCPGEGQREGPVIHILVGE